MRLLYVCSDFGIKPDGTKGASIHLRAITRGLAEEGHELSLLSPHAGPDSSHPAVRLLPPGCPPAEKTGRLLKRWMEHNGYDDAVAKELRPLLYNAWVRDRALDAMADGAPDAIIERLSLFGHVGLDLATELNVPFIVEMNALLTEEAKRFRSLQLQALAEEMQHRVLAKADAILVVSSPLGDRLTSMGVAPEKIHVIQNGVDIRQYEALPSHVDCKARLGLNGRFVVGFSGSLKAWHGVDDLLTAFGMLFERAPNARLLIVGTGPMEAALKNAAQSMGLGEAVVFTGAVQHECVPALLRAMDVAVAPFKRVENFYFSPIKLFEYRWGRSPRSSKTASTACSASPKPRSACLRDCSRRDNPPSFANDWQSEPWSLRAGTTRGNTLRQRQPQSSAISWAPGAQSRPHRIHPILAPWKARC